MQARFVLAALVFTACDTVQDIVPGGVCSWVERAPEYADCTAIRSSSDGDTYTIEYDTFGLVTAELYNGIPSVLTTRDGRGREIAYETPGWTPYQSMTTEWSSCTAGVESGVFDGDSRETVFTLRDGEFESYTRTYGSGRVTTLETEWSGGRIRSKEYQDDGVVSQRTDYEYESLPEGGIRQTQAFTYSGSGYIDLVVLEFDRRDRLTRSEVRADGTVISEARYTYSDGLILEEEDGNGDGVYDRTTTITLDDEGRPLHEITRRNGDIVEEISIAWVCP